MSITDRLLEIKEKIENAKDNKARAEGKLEELMSQLKKEFEVTTIGQAERKLAQLEKEEQSLKKELDEGMGKLEEGYEDLDEIMKNNGEQYRKSSIGRKNSILYKD